jgi:hypothetical protein
LHAARNIEKHLDEDEEVLYNFIRSGGEKKASITKTITKLKKKYKRLVIL